MQPVGLLKHRVFTRLGLLSLVASGAGCDDPEAEQALAGASRIDPASILVSTSALKAPDQRPTPVYEPFLSVSPLAVQHTATITVDGAPPNTHVQVEVGNLPFGSLDLYLATDDEGVAVWEGRTGPLLTGGEILEVRAEIDHEPPLYPEPVAAEVVDNVCPFNAVAQPGSVDILAEDLLIRVVDDLPADGVCDPMTQFHEWRAHDLLVDDMQDLLPDNFVLTPMCHETSIVDGCAYVLHVDDLNVNPPDICWWCYTGGYLGRPFTVGDACRHPLPTRDPGWNDPTELALAERLPRRVRRRLARIWAKQGADEHASIASFARLTLELLALGAPAELVAEATRAQADEIRHARDAFAVASHLARAPVGPGHIDITGALDDRDVRDILLGAVLEGCINETICASWAIEGARTATDPVLREQLHGIAEDETRHAELSWALVQWLLQRHPELADDVAEAAAAYSIGPRPTDDPDASWLAEAGLLDSAGQHDLARQVLRDVIRPALAALVGEARQAA